MLKKSSQKGFTIVELLIVIVVIGILAALVLNTFSGVQKRARDTQRQTDVNALATQLEVSYNDNGYYPSVGNISVPNFKGIDEGALKPPQSNQTSLKGMSAAPTASTDFGVGTSEQYVYRCEVPATIVVNSANVDVCGAYTLYWWKEDATANNVQQKLSLNRP
ncbi:MAG: type II secretion system protein [Candidatus Saccharimonadales bacterium]